MSQPGRPAPPSRAPEPLRVTSQRLTEEEARAAAPAPVHAPATATVAPTGPLSLPDGPDAWGPWPGPAPTVAPAGPLVARPSLPVVAPRPGRRFGELWRLVFTRRRAGRHRPENTPPASWSMFAPQRRRRSRWGRR